MKTLPSKELLSAVLGENIGKVEEVNFISELSYKTYSTNNVPEWEVAIDGMYSRVINIYELQHMMKEWALEQGYELTSNNNFCYVDLVLSTMGHYAVRVDFIANSEPEAVTKACEWILKEISK